jgi:uncharacterized protein (TIGR02147 family)
MVIFEFTNYRDFIRSYVKNLPKNGHGELSKIAAHLRVSTTLLSQILSEHRALTTDQACELAEYLQLTDFETDYFYLLVEYDKAGTHKNKNYYRKKINQAQNEAKKLSKRIEHEKSLNDTDRAVFYSSWVYPAVHLYLGIKPSGFSIEEVAERFDISRPRSAEILQFLLRTSLAIETGGKYKPGVQSTFVEQGSPHLIKHHSNWRIKAIEKSESITNNEMMFTAPISISKKDFGIVREKAVQFIKEVSKIVEKSEAEEIAQFNLDWFWLD